MSREECTIHWRNKPIDKLSSEEMRRALVEALGHAIEPRSGEASAQAFYPGFITGMLAGGFFCFLAVVLLFGLGG
jgi:hypothetical protein